MIRLALIATLLACVAPSQHDPARFGTVRVAFGPALDSAGPWRADQLVELRRELSALCALGPSFVEVDEGSAHLVVRPFDSGAGCAAGVGRFHRGSAYVEIDPACARGFDELRTAMGHECGHFVGMAHICQRAGEAPDCVGALGVAMMNPTIAYDVLPTPDTTSSGETFSQDTPTSLDLAEFLRVHP